MAAKSQRGCNAVAFNREGLLATGLDKVRQDAALNIWDIKQRLGSSDSSRSQPSRKINTETIASVGFFDDQPNLLVAGVSGRQVRIFDLRDSHGSPALQAQTKCGYGLTIDHLDQNYFASYSEDPPGMVAVWDRRWSGRGSGGGGGGAGWTEPVLLFTKATLDEQGRVGQIAGLRYSTQKAGVLAVLNHSGALRVYETAKLPDPVEASAPAVSVFGGAADVKSARAGLLSKDSVSIESSRASKSGETIYVSKVTDIAQPMRAVSKGDKRICSFDWTYAGTGGAASKGGYEGDLKTLCLQNDGELKVLSIPGVSVAATVSSRNAVVATRGTDLIMLPTDSRPGAGAPRPPPTADVQAVDDARSVYRRRPSETLEDAKQFSQYSHQAKPSGQSHLIGSPYGPDAGSEGARRGRDSLIGGVEPGSYSFPPSEILQNDICVVMKRRVERGYGMDVSLSKSAFSVVKTS